MYKKAYQIVKDQEHRVYEKPLLLQQRVAAGADGLRSAYYVLASMTEHQKITMALVKKFADPS